MPYFAANIRVHSNCSDIITEDSASEITSNAPESLCLLEESVQPVLKSPQQIKSNLKALETNLQQALSEVQIRPSTAKESLSHAMVFSPRNYGQTSDDYRKDPFHAGNPAERRRA